jgi:IS30 family transposase
LNHRPRKTLNYRTPHEAFYSSKETLTVALKT